MKKIIGLLLSIILTIGLAACATSGSATEVSTGGAANENIMTAAESTAEVVTAGVTSPAEIVLAGTHEDSDDYKWNSEDEVAISLTGNTAQVEGNGVEVAENLITINQPGNYRVSGSLADGQVIVDSEEDGVIRLILDGADITNTTNAPLFVVKAAVHLERDGLGIHAYGVGIRLHWIRSFLYCQLQLIDCGGRSRKADGGDRVRPRRRDRLTDVPNHGWPLPRRIRRRGINHAGRVP